MHGFKVRFFFNQVEKDSCYNFLKLDLTKEYGKAGKWRWESWDSGIFDDSFGLESHPISVEFTWVVIERQQQFNIRVLLYLSNRRYGSLGNALTERRF